MLHAFARPTSAFLALSLLALSSCGGTERSASSPASEAPNAAPAPASAAPAETAAQPAQTTSDTAPASPAAKTAPANQQSKVIPAEPAGREAASEARPSEAPALPSGTVVLHVGDSFAGALGLPLNKRFKDAGVHGVLQFETASYIPGWSSGDKLRGYINRYSPSLVLITLGANELEIVNPEQRIKNIRKIVATIGDRPCVWIATPLWDGAKNGLFDIIRQNIAPCLYMDTNSLITSMPRVHDGIHPTLEAREDWADVVVDWLRTHRKPTADKPWALSP